MAQYCEQYLLQFRPVQTALHSLIPIDMLSVSRINHPRERLYEGENIRVVLRKREPEKLTFSLNLNFLFA